MSARLLDERSSPPLRAVLGRLLARATAADFAVARIRIAGLDLSSSELGRLRRCRVLVGRLDITTLAEAGEPGGARREHIAALRAFLASGRLQVRAAGLSAWTPDFSVLRGDSPAEVAVVVGAHHFGRPDPPDGPALTCILTDAEEAAGVAARFEELWRRGYDIAAVLAEGLDRLLAPAAASGSAAAPSLAPPEPAPASEGRNGDGT